MDEKTKLAAEIARDIVIAAISKFSTFNENIISNYYVGVFSTVYKLIKAAENGEVH